MTNDVKPREKLMKFGPEKLTDSDLVSIILKTGYKGKTVYEVTEEIFKKYSIKEFITLEHGKLKQIKGIGNVKACELAAAFELVRRGIEEKNHDAIEIRKSTDLLPLLYKERLYTKEHFMCAFLNVRKKLIAIEEIFVGTLSASIVHPREIFEKAIQDCASSIIVIHNHPSDDAHPSDADISVTKRLVTAGKIMGINVVDHLIISRNSYFSFFENGILE